MSGVCVCDRKDWGKGMHAVFAGTLECRRRKKNRGRQAGWRGGLDFPAHYTTLSGCWWRSAPGSMWVPWAHIPPSPEPDEYPPGGFARSRSLSLFSLLSRPVSSFLPFLLFLNPVTYCTDRHARTHDSGQKAFSDAAGGSCCPLV